MTQATLKEVFSSSEISLLQRKKKTMDGGRKQVVKGNSETHCAKIVILLRASSKPILRL